MACRVPRLLGLILRLLFLALWQDLEELQIEDQGLVRRDRTIRAPCRAVAECGRDDQLPMVALAHDLERLGPSPDQGLGNELVRKAVLSAVEHRAVDQLASVVDV